MKSSKRHLLLFVLFTISISFVYAEDANNILLKYQEFASKNTLETKAKVKRFSVYKEENIVSRQGDIVTVKTGSHFLNDEPSTITTRFSKKLKHGYIETYVEDDFTVQQYKSSVYVKVVNPPKDRLVYEFAYSDKDSILVNYLPESGEQHIQVHKGKRLPLRYYSIDDYIATYKQAADAISQNRGDFELDNDGLYVSKDSETTFTLKFSNQHNQFNELYVQFSGGRMLSQFSNFTQIDGLQIPQNMIYRKENGSGIPSVAFEMSNVECKIINKQLLEDNIKRLRGLKESPEKINALNTETLPSE